MRTLSRSERLAAWLCGAGLVLGIGGFWAMRHVPMTAEEEDQERVLQEIMLPAAREAARTHPDDGQLRSVVEQLENASIRSRRPPPYRTEGTIAFIFGVAAFAIGSLLWFGRAGRWKPSGWVKSNDDA